MNIVSVKRHINKLYTTVYKTIKQEFLLVVNQVAEEIYNEVIAMGFDGDLRNVDEAWIEEFFNAYNPVTKYVFSKELDRKKSRLFESLVASRLTKEQSYKTAENLLKRQINQYAIDLEDAIAMVVYEDTGVKRVKWVAEDDYKTCDDCKELDGEVYELHEAPNKLHYNCRCVLQPIKEV